MSAHEVAVRLLALREHSELEIRQKLAKRGFESKEITQLIVDLQNVDLQSDQRFAESYIRSRVSRGEGPVKIRAGLISRGISEQIVIKLFADCEVNWTDLAVKVLDKKFANRGSDHAGESMKCKRFLYYRGFDADVIKQVCSDFD